MFRKIKKNSAHTHCCDTRSELAARVADHRTLFFLLETIKNRTRNTFFGASQKFQCVCVCACVYPNKSNSKKRQQLQQQQCDKTQNTRGHQNLQNAKLRTFADRHSYKRIVSMCFFAYNLFFSHGLRTRILWPNYKHIYGESSTRSSTASIWSARQQHVR